MKVCQLNIYNISDSLLNIKNNKDKVQLFAPIWLEEIQNNKIYKKYSERNQKIEEKTQEIGEIKTENKETSEAEKVDAMETEPKESGDQNTNQAEEKENSRTESDQDC